MGFAAGYTVTNPIVNKTVMLQTVRTASPRFLPVYLGCGELCTHKCPTILHALKEDDDCYWGT
jgi:hypothetical protein